MADNKAICVAPQARDTHQEFLRDLQEHYNMPSETWWMTAHNTFTQLCRILGHKEAVATLDPEDPPGAISARTARDHALPSVTVLATGNYGLRVSATNEPLECAAFGTMSPHTYKEVFWESVVQVQRSGTSTLVIHEVDGGSRFLLTLDSLVFEVKYYHCNAFVRA